MRIPMFRQRLKPLSGKRPLDKLSLLAPLAFILTFLVGGILVIAACALYQYHHNRQLPRGPKPGWRPLSARMGKEPLIPPEPTRWARLRHRISRLARLGRRPRR